MNFEGNIAIQFPTVEKWDINEVIKEEEISVFTHTSMSKAQFHMDP